MPQNNQRPVRIYTKEFKRVLETIFGVEPAFASALQPVQILDGVRDNAVAFTVKTNNTPVVIGTYSTDPNVAFGTGTSTSNRFGNRVEIIYIDTDVPYDYPIAIHEGLDHFTVNEDLDFAVAERQILQAQAILRRANTSNGKTISTNAGTNSVGITLDEASVIAVFSVMKKNYTNMEVIVPVTAYVTADIYSILVKSDLITTNKNSGVNIDAGTVENFMGFRIKTEAEKYFANNDVAYFVPNSIVIPFVGFDMYRALESETFTGVALQAAGKGGSYVAADNAKAIFKLTSNV